MIKAVIFDVDGVIFDTETAWKEAFFSSQKKLGLNLDENWRVHHLVGVAKNDFIANEQPHFPGLNISEWVATMQSYVISQCKSGKVEAKPWVKEIWQFLRENNLSKAIATSGDGSWLGCMFDHIGVDVNAVFSVIVKGVDVEHGKPAPDIFIQAASKLGLTPDECVVLEDSLNGVRAGVGAGCKTIMVLDKVAPDEFAQKNCVAVCNNLLEAQKVIENLLKV